VIRTAVQTVYDATIREYLPRKWGVYGTIPARSLRLFDQTDRFPTYKTGLKTAISANVADGDHVVLVGGGRGVSSTWAARQGATVTAHEAAAEMLPIARETVTMQGVDQQVTVKHSLVGEGIDIYGSAADAVVVSPADLETGDVLMMDCEGAEVSILDGLDDLPETVIVETHPEKGSPTEETKALLEGHDYHIESLVYEPGSTDKRVLVGVATQGGQS